MNLLLMAEDLYRCDLWHVIRALMKFELFESACKREEANESIQFECN